jgi:hypothetical protein
LGVFYFAFTLKIWHNFCSFFVGSRIVIRPDRQPSSENGKPPSICPISYSKFIKISSFFPFSSNYPHFPPFLGIGGAGVVALYKLAFPELAKGRGEMPMNVGNGRFKSDAIFEEIKERAAKVV